MPVDRHCVEGFKAFKEKVAELDKAGKTVIVLFSGSKDDKGELGNKCMELLYETYDFIQARAGARTAK